MVRLLAAAITCACFLASCRQNSSSLARGVDDGSLERYRLKGVVVRRDAEHRILTIKHGPIQNDSGKVWMEPMTMEFPTLKEADFRVATKGAAISAVVVSRSSDFEFWLEDVRPTEVR